MADPLNILIQTALTKAFNLEDAEVDVANGQVLQYIEFLWRSKTLEEAWQQRSFYELLVDNNHAAEENALRSSSDLFTSIFRNNRHMSQAAIDFETYSAGYRTGQHPTSPRPYRPDLLPLQTRRQGGGRSDSRYLDSGAGAGDANALLGRAQRIFRGTARLLFVG
jgi:hypothetical protein